MSLRNKGFPLELSDRIRRLNIRHEALLMKDIERIEKTKKAQLNRMEMSIKAAEIKANSSKSKCKFAALKSKNQNSLDDITACSFDEKALTFLDRQIEGYRNTLHLLSCKDKKGDLLMKTGDRTAETTFDAFFPPISKTVRKGSKNGSKVG